MPRSTSSAVTLTQFASQIKCQRDLRSSRYAPAPIGRGKSIGHSLFSLPRHELPAAHARCSLMTARRNALTREIHKSNSEPVAIKVLLEATDCSVQSGHESRYVPSAQPGAVSAADTRLLRQTAIDKLDDVE